MTTREILSAGLRTEPYTDNRPCSDMDQAPRDQRHSLVPQIHHASSLSIHQGRTRRQAYGTIDLGPRHEHMGIEDSPDVDLQTDRALRIGTNSLTRLEALMA